MIIRSRVYVLNALGSIDVFQQKDPDHYVLDRKHPDATRYQDRPFCARLGKTFRWRGPKGDKSAEFQVFEPN